MAEVPTIEIPETQVAEDSQGDQGQDANTQMYTDSMMNNSMALSRKMTNTGRMPRVKRRDFQWKYPARTRWSFSGGASRRAYSSSANWGSGSRSFTQLVRQGAFLEEEDPMSWSLAKSAVATAIPPSASSEIHPRAGVNNAIACTPWLQRHMAWPPKEFQALSGEQQMNFFLKCAQEKAASGKSQFSYSRVRENLTKVLVDERG